MKTKLLKKLRHKYFDLYIIKYSDKRAEWEIYTRDVDIADNFRLQFVWSEKELSDAQNFLRKLVQGHIINYLKEKGKDPLRANKYL